MPPWLQSVLETQAEIPIELANPPWKRLLDLFLIVLTLPLWLPVMLAISLGILLVSPGPIFFRQERIGYKGLPFNCWKFRSMKVRGDTGQHQSYVKDLIHSNEPMTKIESKGKDARLIPLGKLLRATGLDELPQLINVMKGEMSLVGPRPCTSYEFAEYEDWHKKRFSALPGLTGFWQVTGKNTTTFDQMVHMDIFYAANKNLWFDIKIIAKTIPTLLKQTLLIFK
jgi:lipopolysaccharide/colanic/teichoic acid biosynthesis glycosyltransferase